MQRIVKKPTFRKTVSFKKPSAATNAVGEGHPHGLSKFAPGYSTSRNYDSIKDGELTFGSVISKQLHESDTASNTPSNSRGPCPGSVDQSPANKFMTFSCGHDAAELFTCDVCMNRYCYAFCASLNVCTHKSCKHCSVPCVTCAKRVCVQCMQRCSECFNKLCNRECGYTCSRCQSIICEKCAERKLVRVKTETFLCSQCVDSIFRGERGEPVPSAANTAANSCEWKPIFTSEGKPGLIQHKDGKCFSGKGKYIGRFAENNSHT